MLFLGLFQSSRPVRGATCGGWTRPNSATRFQSSRPVRGATPTTSFTPPPVGYFNPRAPCGRDLDLRPLRVAADISILAPRAGRDPQGIDAFIASADFNPRAPCGARLVHFAVTGHGIAISILAPRAGRDTRKSYRCPRHTNFNRRAPCGARRRFCSGLSRRMYFNPRAPCGARQWKL